MNQNYLFLIEKNWKWKHSLFYFTLLSLPERICLFLPQRSFFACCHWKEMESQNWRGVTQHLYVYLKIFYSFYTCRRIFLFLPGRFLFLLSGEIFCSCRGELKVELLNHEFKGTRSFLSKCCQRFWRLRSFWRIGSRWFLMLSKILTSQVKIKMMRKHFTDWNYFLRTLFLYLTPLFSRLFSFFCTKSCGIGKWYFSKTKVKYLISSDRNIQIESSPFSKKWKWSLSPARVVVNVSIMVK